MARGDAPGLTAVVANRDAILYTGASGRLGAGGDTPMMIDAIFWLASLTKLVTSVAALQLVEQGKLALDAPIAAQLPALAAPRVLTGFDETGVPRFRAAARPITLRYLLTHTSGIGYDTMNTALLRARGAAGPPPATSLASLSGPLLFDPGDGWEYGFSTDWVGLAVEAASGQALDGYFDEHIFEPLGMRDTGFQMSGARAKKCADLHVALEDGGFAPIPSPVANHSEWEFFSGGAGLLGSAGDYACLLRMLLNDGTLDGARILGRESVAALMCNQIGDLRAGQLQTAVPGLCLPFDRFPEQQTRWSFAALINPDPGAEGRAGGSLSWAGFANSYYWVDPTAGMCAVLMAQYLPFADPRMVKVAGEFEAEVYAAALSRL